MATDFSYLKKAMQSEEEKKVQKTNKFSRLSEAMKQDEEARKKAEEAEKQRQTMLAYDTSAGDEEVARLEEQISKAKSDWDLYVSDYKKNGGIIPDGMTRTSPTASQMAGYREYLQKQTEYKSALDGLLKQKEEKASYVSGAKYLQKSAAYSSVADPKSDSYAPDFAEKSKYTGDSGDYLYDFINAEGTGDWKVAALGNRKLTEHYRNRGYDRMEPEEIALYNYYYAQEGKEKAEEYLQHMEKTLKARKDSETVESASKFADKYPHLSSIVSVGTSIGSAGEYVQDVAQYGVDRLTRGEDAVMDTNALSLTTNAIRGTNMENVDWMLGSWDAFDFIYGTVMSGVDSAVASVIPGGGAVLGLSAAAQGTNDALQRGMSSGQAFWNGLFSGVFEGLFESISIGNFEKLKEIAPESIKDVIKNLGKSMLVNASEESLTEIANITYDTMINGEFANYTWEELKNGAWKDALYQVLEAGASGALMGLGMGGVGNAIGYYNGKKQGQTDDVKAPDVTDSSALESGDRALPQSVAASEEAPTASSLDRGSQGEAAAGKPVTIQEVAKGYGAQAKAVEAVYQEGQDAGAFDKAFSLAHRVGQEGGNLDVLMGSSAVNTVLKPSQIKLAYAIGADSLDIYHAGLVGADIGELQSQKSALTREQKTELYKAAMVDAKTAYEQGKQTGFVNKGKASGIVDTKYARKIRRESPRSYVETQRAAREMGVAIEITDISNELNGTIKNGVIQVNAAAFLGKNRRTTLARILAHEVTHRLKETAQDAYLAYRNYAIGKMAERGDGSLEATIRGYQEKYSGRDKLTQEEAMDEIAADYTQFFVDDIQEFKALAKRDLSWAQRMIQALRNILDKIRGVTRDSQIAGDYGKALKLWEKAYAEAREAVKKAPVGGQGDGSLRYSLGDIKIPTREELEKKPDIKVIDISSPKTTGTFAERRRQILKNAEEVIKKPYLNKDTGAMIFLTEKSYTHMFSNPGEVQINASEHLPEFVENAVLTHFEPPRYGNPNTVGVYTFFAAAKTNDILPVKLKVKEYRIADQDIPQNIIAYFDSLPDGYASSYDTVVLEVGEIEKSPIGSAMHTNQNDLSHSPTELSNIKISDLLDLVKGEAKKYIPRHTESKEALYSVAGAEDILAENEARERETRRTKERLEYFRKQVAATKDKTVDPKAVNKLAREIVSQWGVELEAGEIAQELQEILDHAVRMDDTDFYGAAVELGRKIADEITTTDGDLFREYAELRKALRDMPIFISESITHDIPDYFDTVRPYRNRLKLSTKGGKQSLDQAYTSLSMEHPALFPADVFGSDQLRKLLEVTDSLYQRGQEHLLEPQDAEFAAMEIANDIFGRIYDLPTFKSIKDVVKDATLAGRMAQGREDAKRIRRVQERLDKVREAKEDELKLMREKNRDRVDAMRESADVKRYRERVEKKAKSLSNALLKNSDKEHIPENLKQVVGGFLQSIDFSSRTLRKKGAETKRDLSYSQLLGRVSDALNRQSELQSQEGESAGYYLDLPAEFMAMIAEHRRTVEDAAGGLDVETNQVYAMDSAQLKDLDYLLGVLQHSIQKINSLTENGRYSTAREAARDSILFMKSSGSKLRGNTAFGKAAGQFALWDNELPVYAFRRFGEGGKAIFEGLQNGWDRLAFNAKDVIGFAQNTYTGEEVKQWGKEVRSITLSSGETVKMTTAQLMSLYCLFKREQARGHLLGGGIRVADFQEKGKAVSQTEPYLLGIADLEIISEALSDRQMAVADSIQKYMSTVGSQWGNEVSMKRFGYRAFTESNYFPITSDSTNLPGMDPKAQSNDMFRLLNLSMTKGLTRKANNALVVFDIFDVFSAHMADMAKYNALALPILDAMKWYNFVDKQVMENGQVRTQNVKRAMEAAYGKSAENYFTSFMKDLNGKSEGGRGEGPARKLLSNYKVASVAANLRVALLQPTSYIRAANVIDPKYLALALKKKPAIREMEENSGIAVWKDLGFFDTNIGRGLQEQIKNQVKLKDKVSDISMTGAEMADKLTWGVLWNACKLECEAKQLKGETLLEETAKRFREVVYGTQVVDSTMTRSHMMRSRSLFSNIATSFMSEPTLTYNMLTEAAVDFGTAPKGKKTEKAKILGRTFSVFAFTAGASALIEALASAWRDDDEYASFMEKFKASFGESFLGNVNPANMIPYARDVMSMIDGYESTRADLEGIENLIDVVKIWYETWNVTQNGAEWTDTTYNGRMTLYGKIYKTLQAVSQIAGLPGSALAREAVSLWNNTFGTWYGMKVKTYDPGEKNSIKYAYKDGYLTAGEAAGLLLEKGLEKDREKAEDTVAEWDSDEIIAAFKKVYSEARDISYSAVEKYNDYCKSEGISEEVYYKAWAQKKSLTGSGNVKEQMLTYIDGLALSKKQKDSLYYAFGWAESKIGEAPWN